jgi:hypothetical protein
MKFLIPIWIPFLLQSVAYASTYNFYFNNTEQGANSVANPHVKIVKGENGELPKIEKKGEGELISSIPVKPVPEPEVPKVLSEKTTIVKTTELVPQTVSKDPINAVDPSTVEPSGPSEIQEEAL